MSSFQFMKNMEALTTLSKVLQVKVTVPTQESGCANNGIEVGRMGPRIYPAPSFVQLLPSHLALTPGRGPVSSPCRSSRAQIGRRLAVTGMGIGVQGCRFGCSQRLGRDPGTGMHGGSK